MKALLLLLFLLPTLALGELVLGIGNDLGVGLGSGGVMKRLLAGVDIQDFANRYRWNPLLGRKPRQNHDAPPYDLTDTSQFGITTADNTHLLLTGSRRKVRGG